VRSVWSRSCLWLQREWRHPNPMIDVRRLGERQLGLTMLLMALFGLGTSQADVAGAADRPATGMDRHRPRPERDARRRR
jgi:hypothetical protein